jgi:flavodoxin
MKAVVVYDSIFGNTAKIAQAVAEGLGSQAEVELLRVGEVGAEQLKDIDLLVVGSPTRGFRPTPAVKVFLETLAIHKLRCAAFDTRLSARDAHSWVLGILESCFGWAAGPIGQGLKRKGGLLLLPPEGFYVQASEGPLKAGELERAAAWGGRLLAA